ncbi:hypothetical protein BDY19DRAFT_316197 [Irpex rosettiformis]|uniref:Uncharacterized protein n=1 Tax=Irpex rosettiformis TaxID=378272 RepID=A0ACB8TY88_9APHY|nr:hypothetical protein BDY19DRAFT_316197 [Irpex rosettiformis]
MKKFNNPKTELIGWQMTIMGDMPQHITHLFNALETSSILVSELYPSLADVTPSLITLPPGLMRITPTFVACISIIAAAALIRLACYRALKHMFTFELSIKKDHRLITNGPYAFVRHPSYTAIIAHKVASLMIQLGPGSWWYESGYWGSPLGISLALAWIALRWKVILFFFDRVGKEDQVLREEFGKEWEEWRKRTPYKLVPLVW